MVECSVAFCIGMAPNTELDFESGVNTGFGGSANTRTKAVEELQRLLVRELHYGILAQPDTLKFQKEGEKPQAMTTLPLDDTMAATCMPESWTRAGMIIRLNSLSSGASGVHLSTVNALAQLLEHNITPRIPIRGSISASGDLSPLSYIGGVMQGKSTLTTWAGDRSTGQRRIVKANLALAEANIKPIVLGAKEGLAIVNGTAISAGVAALAMHEIHAQAILSQVLTAMSVEALRGTDESFDRFFAEVRPHPGQRESAANIYAFLAESRLVHRSDGSEETSLRQDRYSIRTASQWLGPVLEDLLLAHQQVLIEINSVTDNPLVDAQQNRMLHGGNFQAKAITSAMEKVRQGCQTIGRMLSVQCTELINPATNRGLPPNLVIDEPSVSYIWKGSDIMIAALQSELGFLANSVGSHVQSAEMGNQALNSLALISARYTLDALDVLTQISAVHLIALCQGMDIRVMNINFLNAFESTFAQEFRGSFESLSEDYSWLDRLEPILWSAFKRSCDETTSRDSERRFEFIITSLQPKILELAPSSVETLLALKAWTKRCSFLALEAYTINRDSYILNPNAVPYLGSASRHMYKFVREQLHVPLMHKECIRTPEPELVDGETDHTRNDQSEALDTLTVGSFMTAVYESMRNGTLYAVVMRCLQEITGPETSSHDSGGQKQGPLSFETMVHEGG